MARMPGCSKSSNAPDSFNREGAGVSSSVQTLRSLGLSLTDRHGMVFASRVGRTIKQGFVAFPLCVVLLAEKEMLQTCAKCEAVERLDAVERYKRCGRCKRRYYVSIWQRPWSIPYPSFPH